MYHFDSLLVRRDRHFRVRLFVLFILVYFTKFLQDKSTISLQVDNLN